MALLVVPCRCLQTYIETGDVVHKIETPDGTFSVAWHPTQLLLAFAGDEKARDGDRYP